MRKAAINVEHGKTPFPHSKDVPVRPSLRSGVLLLTRDLHVRPREAERRLVKVEELHYSGTETVLQRAQLALQCGLPPCESVRLVLRQASRLRRVPGARARTVATYHGLARAPHSFLPVFRAAKCDFGKQLVFSRSPRV